MKKGSCTPPEAGRPELSRNLDRRTSSEAQVLEASKDHSIH